LLQIADGQEAPLCSDRIAAKSGQPCLQSRPEFVRFQFVRITLLNLDILVLVAKDLK
jgi:hypothetical protein